MTSTYNRLADEARTDRAKDARAEKMRALTAKMDAVPGLAAERAAADARLAAIIAAQRAALAK